MNEQNYRFETLQLHAGQEHPDPAQRRQSRPDLCDDILCL